MECVIFWQLSEKDPYKLTDRKQVTFERNVGLLVNKAESAMYFVDNLWFNLCSIDSRLVIHSSRRLREVILNILNINVSLQLDLHLV